MLLSLEDELVLGLWGESGERLFRMSCTICLYFSGCLFLFMLSIDLSVNIFFSSSFMLVIGPLLKRILASSFAILLTFTSVHLFFFSFLSFSFNSLSAFSWYSLGCANYECTPSPCLLAKLRLHHSQSNPTAGRGSWDPQQQYLRRR